MPTDNVVRKFRSLCKKLGGNIKKEKVSIADLEILTCTLPSEEYVSIDMYDNKIEVSFGYGKTLASALFDEKMTISTKHPQEAVLYNTLNSEGRIIGSFKTMELWLSKKPELKGRYQLSFY